MLSVKHRVGGWEWGRRCWLEIVYNIEDGALKSFEHDGADDDDDDHHRRRDEDGDAPQG